MEISVVDHRRALTLPALRKQTNRRDEIGSTERLATRLEMFEELVDPPGHGRYGCLDGSAGEFGIDGVYIRHRDCELDWRAGEQRRRAPQWPVGP